MSTAGRTARTSRRAVFGVVDQVLSSGTNFLTAFVASIVLVPAGFASFVVAYAVVTIVLAVGRAVVGDPLLAYVPTVARAGRRAVVRSASGAALTLGVVGATVAVALGLIVPALHDLLWLAPWIPVALLQDAGRFAFIARGDAGAALAADLGWAGVQLAAMATVGLVSAFSPASLATTWGLGALGGLGVVVALGRGTFRPCWPRDWARRTRHLSGWFTVTSILGQCEIYAVLVLAGVLLAPLDAAGLRAVQLLVFAPAVMLVTAMIMLVTPVVARAVARGDVTGVRDARRASSAAAGVLALAVLAVVPLRGELLSLFFPRYVGFGPLVVPLAVQTACYVLGASAVPVLRGFHRARVLAALHVSLSLGLIGAAAVAMPHGVLVTGWALAGVTAAASLAMALAAPLPHRATAGHPVPARVLAEAA